MGYSCVVPNCNSGHHTNKSKISLFSIPKDRLKDFQLAIQRSDRLLTIKDYVCEKHFRDEDIIRKVETKCYSYELKYPRLSKDAIPSVFPGCPKYLTRGTKKHWSIKKYDIPLISMSRETETMTISFEDKKLDEVSKKRVCVVSGCGSKESGPSFFGFPNRKKSIDMFMNWVRAVGNPDFLNAEKVTLSQRVCSRHFIESDYCGHPKRLKPTAVPSKFLPEPLTFRSTINLPVQSNNNGKLTENFETARTTIPLIKIDPEDLSFISYNEMYNNYSNGPAGIQESKNNVKNEYVLPRRKVRHRPQKPSCFTVLTKLLKLQKRKRLKLIPIPKKLLNEGIRLKRSIAKVRKRYFLCKRKIELIKNVI